MKVNTEFKLEAIPEKVYAMLRLIVSKEYTREQILNMMQLQNAGGTEVINYIEQNEWVEKDGEGKYYLLLNPEILQDIQTFRKHINKHLFEGNKTWYYEFTKWYMSQDEEILQYTQKDLYKNSPDILQGQSDKSVLYWRLWSSFLGFGNLHKKIFIPNPYMRIKDVLELDKELERNKEIQMKTFISWLKVKCPEMVDCVNDQDISVFLSLALRVLHDLGVIKLLNKQDATDIWHLTTEQYHDIKCNVTHIEVKGV